MTHAGFDGGGGGSKTYDCFVVRRDSADIMGDTTVGRERGGGGGGGNGTRRSRLGV